MGFFVFGIFCPGDYVLPAKFFEFWGGGRPGMFHIPNLFLIFMTFLGNFRAQKKKLLPMPRKLPMPAAPIGKTNKKC